MQCWWGLRSWAERELCVSRHGIAAVRTVDCIHVYIPVQKRRGGGLVVFARSSYASVRSLDSLCCTVLVLRQLIIGRHQQCYGLGPGCAWFSTNTERDGTRVNEREDEGQKTVGTSGRSTRGWWTEFSQFCRVQSARVQGWQTFSFCV